jgi:hypothetical protein
MVRTYASVASIVLVSLSLAGFVGVTQMDLPANVFHLGVGSLFVYLGFFQRDAEVVRRMVGGLGVLLLSVKGVVILVPLLWGEPPLLAPVEVTCLVAGLLSILAARYLPQEHASRD